MQDILLIKKVLSTDKNFHNHSKFDVKKISYFINMLSRSFPQIHSHFQFGVSFFRIVLIVFFKFSSVLISFAIFSAPWIIVEWSRPPRRLPTLLKEYSVSSLQRYINICLGKTISDVLFFELMSAGSILKCSLTTLRINSGVIFFWASGDTRQAIFSLV